METSSASLSSKRRIRCDVDEDRISRLPDEVLTHILAFLPTKNAVLTSILSNRWRSSWALVPNLKFDDSSMFTRGSQNPSLEICFMNLVTRVLLLRSSTPCSIYKFRLICCHVYDPSLVNSWICYAIANGVRVLDLLYRYDNRAASVDLPRRLLSCKKLEVLKLQSNFRIRFPDSICLPNLRVLHLILLKIDSDSMVANLISSCPVLEELDIQRMHSHSLKHLVIISCSLKILRIHEFVSSGEVVIDAPNLELVDLILLHGSYDMKSELPFLVKANIDAEQYGLCRSARQKKLVELLRAISNVRFLTVTDYTIKCLDQQRLDNLPIFHNLKHLVVEKYSKSWLVLSAVLQCSPNLITFVLKMADKVRRNLYEWHPQLSSRNMLYLEKIELESFEGTQNEMGLVSCLLKNATVLKKMSIRYRHSNTVKDVSEIVKKLLMFPRGSTTCQIEFL